MTPLSSTRAASIRYTVQNDWLIVRGMGTRTRGAGGFSQFCQGASTLRQLPQYCGASFSAGDAEIDAIGQRTTKCGNLETWLWIGINHHVTFAVRQIQNFPASPTFP
ncbi:MAG: hypothetical protein HC888_17745 [Candidatus Competibacteraceae bacterium]|nr:hypothetical protein [Candidatus Competibacteraceae bacterium]